MNEINPLNLSPKKFHPILNKSGRPSKEKLIKFGPQPRSIISQLLQKQKDESVTIVETHSETASLNLAKGCLRQTQDLSSNVSEDVCLASNVQAEFGMPKNPKKKEEKLYACDHQDCTYSTRISSNLSKHKRTHTSEKPYLCDTCSFQTKFVNSLKTHKRIHTNVRPYICEFCSYCCNSSSNLKKHFKHKHFTELTTERYNC